MKELRNTKTPQGTETVTTASSNAYDFITIEKYEDPAGDGNYLLSECINDALIEKYEDPAGDGNFAQFVKDVRRLN